MKIDSWRELKVYQQSFSLQQEVFTLSARWPRLEGYSLTDQIRRSSRSIGANIAEAWAKRRYPAHFLSKLTDADGEVQETLHWLATAEACDYLDQQTSESLSRSYNTLGQMLGRMLIQHKKFCY